MYAASFEEVANFLFHGILSEDIERLHNGWIKNENIGQTASLKLKIRDLSRSERRCI